jgi:hypothetical protein
MDDKKIIFIISYRNIDVFFNNETEKFYSEYTPEKDKLHIVKKNIDEYIKENYNFKPFKVIDIDNYLSDLTYHKGKVTQITGVRKDGGFQTSGGMISSVDIDRGYIKYHIIKEDKLNEVNEYININKIEINKLKNEIKLLEENNKIKLKEMCVEDLKIYRDKLIGNE